MTDLYFVTWDEVEEGQQVWAFAIEGGTKMASIYRKNKDFLQVLTDIPTQFRWHRSDINGESLKFIPAPKDRPEPNVWDKFMVKETTVLQAGFNCGFGSLLTIKKSMVLSSKDRFRALAAWINHVLEQDKT